MVAKGLLKGQRVRVVANLSSHSTPIGRELTILGQYPESSGDKGYLVQESGNWYAFSDLELLEQSKPLYEKLEDEAQDLNEKASILEGTAKALRTAKVDHLTDSELKELKRVVISEMDLGPVQMARLLSKI